jgi:hypothetical protein
MASLTDLLASLASAQTTKAKARLSERNVVELVAKLRGLGLLGDELLHTIDGREYVTPERLRADIATALASAGGRLELVELPAAVGVDLLHCERQAAALVAASGGSVVQARRAGCRASSSLAPCGSAARRRGAAARRPPPLDRCAACSRHPLLSSHSAHALLPPRSTIIMNSKAQAQGELMTAAYFDSLAAEVADGLAATGVARIGDLASAHGLGAELLLSVLGPRVAAPGGLGGARMEGGLLYTPAFLRNIKAQLRGALRAATAPVALAALMREAGVEGAAALGGGGGAAAGIAPALVEEILAEGGVAGSLRAGQWLPDCFAAAQRDAARRARARPLHAASPPPLLPACPKPRRPSARRRPSALL